MSNPETANAMLKSLASLEANSANVADDVAELKKAVLVGNGQPGLLSRVTSIETALKVLYGLVVVALTAIGAWAAVKGVR